MNKGLRVSQKSIYMNILFLVTCSVVTLILAYFSIFLLVGIVGGKNFGTLIKTIKRENAPKQTELKLIGCGCARTGTMSTKFALEKLGYRSYHMMDVISLGHELLWADAFENREKLDIAIDTILSLGFNATIDFPTSLLCIEIMERFTNAKAHLTVRDNPEKWMNSFKNLYSSEAILLKSTFPLQILGEGTLRLFEAMFAHLGISDSKHLHFLDSVYPWANKERFIESVEFDELEVKQAYLDHNERVRKTYYLSEKLLVFNVKEGWDPMTEFLGVGKRSDVESFPHINQSEFWIVVKHTVRFLAEYYPFVIFGDFVVLIIWVSFFLSCCGCNGKKSKKRRIKNE